MGKQKNCKHYKGICEIDGNRCLLEKGELCYNYDENETEQQNTRDITIISKEEVKK